MDTSWLEAFREVARAGSLTAASRTLGYTQSALSRQIAALESEVGATLLDRLPRGVRLTDEGQFLLDHADAVLDRLDHARRDLAALRDLTTGRLRLGAFATANSSLVPRAIAAFRAAYPHITLRFAEERTRELAAALGAGDLDLAIISAYDSGLSELDGLELRQVFEDPILIALPSGHPRAGDSTVRIADLADESWIAGNAVAEETLISACLRQGFRPHIDHVVREWTAKQGFVAAGLGITLVPALGAGAVRGDVTGVTNMTGLDGIVLRALHPDDTPVRSIYVATPRGRSPSAAVAGFGACLDEAVDGFAAELRSRGIRLPMDRPDSG